MHKCEQGSIFDLYPFDEELGWHLDDTRQVMSVTSLGVPAQQLAGSFSVTLLAPGKDFTVVAEGK